MGYNMIKISRVISPATNVIDPLILPLTFFDLFWLPEIPMKRLTFYRLTDSSCDALYSVMLPKLEQSLSLVLAHFLPLYGNLRWNPEDPKLHIVISPQDALSLTLLHRNHNAPCSMDRKTLVKFLKSWAHFCKFGTIPEDLDLPMLLDRTVINVPAELESKVLELFTYDKANVITLKLHSVKENGDDAIKFTLELTQENVKKLRERAKSESTRSDLHMSTFVLTYDYVLTWVVKARRVDANQLTPVPVSYFGNCVLPINFKGYKAETFLGEDGFINGVEILSDSVRGLSSPGAERIWELDEIGGVEIGMCLKKSEIDFFISIFQNGLDN
ncbi:hypothetical protein N665_1219s0009 [Sinapis alba]|nr:hypothetical protein N665_1219s0009 [Sinapis alba]